MDAAAELTLQIAQAMQRRDISQSPPHWIFWPEGTRATWAEARDLLASAPKPLLIAPLIEPGSLGLWQASAFDEAKRTAFGHQFQNQLGYYAEKLTALGLSPGDTLRFDAGNSPCTIRVSEFLTWAAEYALAAGISLGESTEARCGLILVRPPGGSAPPLGSAGSHQPRSANVRCS
jgi:hypothetical protein